MSKGLEALETLGKIKVDNDIETFVIKNISEYKTIEKELKVLEIIRDNISYIMALCDRTKNPDNDFVFFEIKGLLDSETWSKVYEVLKSPIKEVLL